MRREPIAVGLLGLGTVGGGVARLLLEEPDRIARRCGGPVELKWAAVRDLTRPRDTPLPASRITLDAMRVIHDPQVQVIIETMGGIEPARSYLLAALDAGKDVVTANKALLAEHGTEIFARARSCGRSVSFEASVGGGIPIVNAIGVGLAANQIKSLAAILNGTCNFILTSMTRDGLSYDIALSQAQALGFAEADPTLDVDGTDTAHKLAILAQLAFGVTVATSDIPRKGIDTLQSADIGYARELGYTVKLLALAEHSDAGLQLRVAPTLVRNGTPLAEVRGPYNAVRVVGDAVGDTLFYGRGAGMMPTASAVVGDLVDVIVGRAGLTFRALNLWPDSPEPLTLADPNKVHRRYYLRFFIQDRPGVLSQLASVLGEHGISIASVIQHEPGDMHTPAEFVPLVIMTHSAIEAHLEAALREIDGLNVVSPPSVCMGVEE